MTELQLYFVGIGLIYLVAFLCAVANWYFLIGVFCEGCTVKDFLVINFWWSLDFFCLGCILVFIVAIVLKVIMYFYTGSWAYWWFLSWPYVIWTPVIGISALFAKDALTGPRKK